MRNLLLLLIILTAVACGEPALTAEEGARKIAEGALVVDVRTEEEFNEGHLEGALHIPYQNIAEALDKLPRDREIVLYCRSGRRSGVALETLRAKGYTKAFNGGGYGKLRAATRE